MMRFIDDFWSRLVLLPERWRCSYATSPNQKCGQS